MSIINVLFLDQYCLKLETIVWFTLLLSVSVTQRWGWNTETCPPGFCKIQVANFVKVSRKFFRKNLFTLMFRFMQDRNLLETLWTFFMLSVADKLFWNTYLFYKSWPILCLVTWHNALYIYLNIWTLKQNILHLITLSLLFNI